MKELSKEQVEYVVSSLKKVVEFRQLSQMQLEQLSGVNQSTISKVFCRTLDPSYEVLKRLYQAVGLKSADVLYETEDHTHDLYGYLATPLTGVVRNSRAEKELLDVVDESRRLQSRFEILEWTSTGRGTTPTR